MIELKLEGMAEIRKQLIALKGAAGSEKTIRRASRKAMQPVLDRAIATAPYDASPDHEGAHLRDSLRITTKMNKATGVLTVGIKVIKLKGTLAGGKRVGKAVFAKLSKSTKRKLMRQSAAWRLHFIETGAPGRGIPAQPFIRPAFDSNVHKMLAIIKESIDAEIQKEIRKRARAAKRAARGKT